MPSHIIAAMMARQSTLRRVATQRREQRVRRIVR
jgi:hypothetical protein